ncbi:ParA family protein [Serratia fonticola]|uniref:ParA family protein n=1 Tax=Serratia fonticola TaxID=47917 RepID=A0AAW3WWG0_SERFO|nr:ParA family protein [Serratia fonticola]MBC3214762.1 ParA family protein [Serratia fonticola]NYA15845.1 ParA family protein [Serratia fonticola]NYA35683.1 ParA family protein [Serratia fonticola]
MKKALNPYTGMIVAVGIKKGGTGKSMIALNIAPEINPDVFYDTDDTSSISTFNSFRPEDKRWNVIRLTDDMEGVTNRFITELVAAKEQGKTVLVDCGGFDSALTRAAVGAADLIISPFIDDPSEILGLQKFSEVLEQISKDMGEKKIAHVLLNKVHPQRTNFTDVDTFISQFDNLVRFDTAIPADKTLPARFGEGMGIVELVATRHGRAGNAMRSLFLDMRTAIEKV